MDEATRDRRFEPFYTTKDVGKGTGLGLATVLSIVRQNGGCIDVETVPGEGTKVSIFLPSYQGETKTAGTDTTNEPLFGGRETVLVVDDELALLKLVSRMLDELGYRVLTASSPAQAVEMVSRHGAAIDVLLTDVVMPGMNGLNLAARLRTLHPHIGLVYMSGYAPQVLGNQGVFDDGQPFLQKPFSIKELAEKILQALATG
jgi:CheY-like chemotaxis protein